MSASLVDEYVEGADALAAAAGTDLKGASPRSTGASRCARR